MASPEKALSDLFLSHFTAEQLHRFLVQQYGRLFLAELPNLSGPLAYFVDAAVAELGRKGLITKDLFAALAECLPAAGGDIGVVAKCFGDGSPYAQLHSVRGVSHTRRTPNNLRVRNTQFRGRERELAELEELLSAERTVTVTHASLYGLGGIGKTALALELAHRALDSGSYPGGVWWVAAEGDPTEALVAFMPVLRRHAPPDAQLRLPGADARAWAIAEGVRLTLQEQTKASLLILDNVSQRWGRHIPGGEVRVLMTTRDEGWAIGTSLRLDVLPKEQALQLAEAITGKATSKVEIAACRRVVMGELGGLAVAVEMAARAVKKWFNGSWCAYDRMLQRELEQLLEASQLLGDYERGVFAAIDLSIDKCDETARLLLEAAATLAPEAVPVEWVFFASALNGQELIRARAMATLKELGLITGSYNHSEISMHRLVHWRIRVRAERERKEVWGRVSFAAMEAVSEWIVRASRQFQTRSEMEQVDARLKHVAQALIVADMAGDDVEWVIIANRLATHLQNRGEYDQCLVLYKQALERAEAVMPPDLSLVAVSLSDLAGAYCMLREDTKARPLLERASAIDLQSSVLDHQIAQRLSNLAQMFVSDNEFERALPLAIRAVAIDEQLFGPEHPEVSMRLSTLAYIYNGLGANAVARQLFERVLAIDEVAYGADHPRVAMGLMDLAISYMGDGQGEHALALMRRALRIDEATYGPDHPNVALRLFGTATVLVSLGQYASARSFAERAVVIGDARLPPEHSDLALYRKLLNSIGPLAGDLSCP